ncbi:amino acid ABC transporter substrate-binding protein [Thermodesulfobacteriota bacterium B35]
MRKTASITLLLLVVLLVVGAAATTLDEVRKRGTLRCGVSTGLAGFSKPDAKGRWTGLDVDVCRAVAAAVLGDAERVQFVPLTRQERFTRLQAGEVDLLARNTAWTLTRDSSLGLNFTHTTFFDALHFLVTKKLGVRSAGELDGSTVCLQPDDPDSRLVADFFARNRMHYRVVSVDSLQQAVSGFEGGRCDVLPCFLSALPGLRARLTRPAEAVTLPEIVARAPLGPVVRQGDDGWFNIVRWTIFAMIDAEELGVRSGNVDEMLDSPNPAIRRLLGLEGIRGVGLGLADDWARRVIRQVGNYGEVFARNLGSGSSLKMQRGLNALWNSGGIQYAPPFR